jgi:hypothetical protein
MCGAQGHFLSDDFKNIGWQKPLIAELATRLRVPLLISDIDVVFSHPPWMPLHALAARGRAVAFMASAYSGVNIGLVYVNSHEAIAAT